MTRPIISILVADDDPLIGPLLRDILLYLGHVVCAITTNEDAAVEAAVHHRPDLIMMDAQLRQGNGIDAMDRIVALIGPTPHIFISGDLHGILARAPGAITLQKPFRIEQIEGAIRRTLEPAETMASNWD